REREGKRERKGGSPAAELGPEVGRLGWGGQGRRGWGGPGGEERERGIEKRRERKGRRRPEKVPEVGRRRLGESPASGWVTGVGRWRQIRLGVGKFI
ncbi:hypothetical protein TIFTF001_054471, partial [Ficus carica]